MKKCHALRVVVGLLLCGALPVWSQFAGMSTTSRVESAPVRLECRADFGGRVVRGEVPLSEEEGAVTLDGTALGDAWDTTALADGWRTLALGDSTAEVCVRNDAGIALDEGRLTENTVWDGSAVHVVRNDVYVPRGVTLTLAAGAVVKFTEDTRLIVEHGGKVVVAGTDEAPVRFALATDDMVGGDTDLREGKPAGGTASRVYCYDATSGWSDNGMLVLHGVKANALPSLSVKSATALRQSGEALVPVSVSGTRTQGFWVEWEALDGTARHGVDFTERTGRVTWGSTSDGVRFIRIPLLQEEEMTAPRTFTVRLTCAAGANVAVAEATVTLSDSPEAFDGLASATGASAPVRLECRADFGGRVVRGEVPLSQEEGAVTLDGAELGDAWDTSALADGWRTLAQGVHTAEVCVRNDAGIALEEGRLTANTVWDGSAVHVVRNDVYVPHGVTLTLAAGAVVKFTEDTRVVVEHGGKVVLSGTAESPVQVALATDDAFGGDTDIREAAMDETNRALFYCHDTGTGWSDNGQVVSRYGQLSNASPTVTLHSVMVFEDAGEALLPVTVSGTRNMPFSVRWEAIDGTAQLGRDYGLSAGMVSWTKTDEGTKYIRVPIVAGDLADETETFTVRLVVLGSVNASVARSATVTIRRLAAESQFAPLVAHGVSAPVRLEQRSDFGGRVVRGVVPLSEGEGAVTLDGAALGDAWDTTALSDGWLTLALGERTAEVCVRNDAGIALEEGRLTESTVWDGSAVHVVRNDVYVPREVTLTLAEGAVVKFTEDTRIIVEHGGKVVVAGTAESPVTLALVTDDAVGGDTDVREAAMAETSRSLISCYDTGTGWSDNGCLVTRKVRVGVLPTVSVHPAAVAEHEGVVYVPVTVAGSRSQPFSVTWRAEAGTALPGEDVVQTSGTVTWMSTSQGTGYIRIDLTRDDVREEPETFTVRLDAGQGCSVATRTAEVTIWETDLALASDADYQAVTGVSAATVVDVRTDMVSRLANEVETLRYSAAWAGRGDAAAVKVTVQLDADGETPVPLVSSQTGEPLEGTVDWQTYALGTGRYLLAHETLDERGNLLERLETTFFINRDIRLHGGRLTADETWDASVIHVVVQDVLVPAGIQLTITQQAVVKFLDGCGIEVLLGGVANATGAIFTHIADDSAGGDTNLDGVESLPTYDAYTLGGAGAFHLDGSCELRSKSSTLPSGTLTANLKLTGNMVYKATGTLTVAQGVTLTIGAGAVLKFDSGQELVVRGEMVAQGTRAHPIVFTSIRDDAHGGDTNGDRTATVPQPGDWGQITISGGSAQMEHCAILYPRGSNNQGGLYVASGSLNFHNGEIAHTVFDCLRSGGNAVITNSVLHDTSLGFAPAGGTNLMANCVIYDATTCVRWPSATLVNCIFAQSREFVDTSFGTGMTFRHCVFWNPKGTGQQSCFAVGRNGNIWADPLFTAPDAGDFSLQANSPCIDAGDGSEAPELDYWGKPRMNCVRIHDTGTVAANGSVPDIGIYEYPGVGGNDVPDLRVNWVQGPEAGVSGEDITVTWQVENAGTVAWQGVWEDTVTATSAEAVLGDQQVELGVATMRGSLQPGERQTITRTFRLPAMMPGAWRLAVTANSGLSIYEQNARNNRVESVETADIQVPTFQDKRFYVLSRGEDIAFSVGNNMILQLFSSGADKLSWHFGDGFIPSETHYSSFARRLGDGRVLLIIPGSLSESGFIRISNDSLQGVTFKLAAIDVADRICDISPTSLPKQELATLSFTLLDASPVKSVVIQNGSTSIPAKSISTNNMGQTVAIFDLSTAESVQSSLVVVTELGMRHVAENVLTLLNTVRHPKLEAWLELPASVREGRQYVGYICYKNTGTADMNAPVFRVIGQGNTKVKVKLDGEFKETVYLYGAGTNPVTLLRADEEGHVPFYFSFTGGCSLRFDTMSFPDEEYQGSSTLATWKDLERAVHQAALRLFKRGKVESDFSALCDFAERETVSEFSGISGYAYHAKSYLALENTVLVATEVTEQENPLQFRVETDSNGYFCFEALPGDKEYIITLDFAETISEGTITTVSGQDVNNVEILGIPLGNLNGYVTMAEGQPVAEDDYSVELWLENSFQAHASMPLSDSGTFEFRHLIPGNYYLKVCKGEDKVVMLTSDVIVMGDYGNTRSVALELGHPGRLFGMALTEDKRPCGEENLLLMANGENNEQFCATIQEDGSWEISGISAGIYRLTLEGGEWVLADDVLVSIQPNESLDAGELVIVPKADFVPFPTMGAGPLKVQCHFVRDKSTEGYAFAWDFDGDGVTDSTIPDPTWVYTALGDHPITLSLTTANGEVIQSQQTVTVVEPVENVLREDVILLHNMDNPPYEFVSWDGTTLVMREVDEYPIKLEEGVKVLFKYVDGKDYAVKILTSRRYADCYYLTVDDATLTDLFSSFDFTISAQENEKATRGWLPDLKVSQGGFTIEPGYERLGHYLHFFYDENNDICAFEYLDGFELNLLIRAARTTIGMGWDHSDGKRLIGPEKLEKKDKTNIMNFVFPVGPLPCQFLLDFYWDISLLFECDLAFFELKLADKVTWVKGKRKINGKWMDLRSGKPKNEFDADWGTGQFLPKIKGTFGFGLQPRLLVCGGSFTEKAEVSLLEISGKVGGELSFDVSDKKRSLSVGIKAEAKVSLFNTSLKIGKFSWEWSLGKLTLFDDFLVGRTWLFGVPMERFDFDASPFFAESDSYEVLFSSSGPETEKQEVTSKWGLFKTIYCPASSISKRQWNFGDGCVEIHDTASHSESFTHTFKGKAPYMVSLLPYQSILGVDMAGVNYRRMVAPKGENVICPRCGHTPGLISYLCDCICHGRYDLPENQTDVPFLQSCDPNEMVGPRGVGDPATQRLVRPGEWLDYTVYFENKSTAEASAQEVRVDLTLDGSLLDLSTFQLGTVAFGSQQVQTLKGKAQGKFAVNQTGTPWQVRGEASGDAATGQVRWYLRSYDPANAVGGHWPAAATAGFLPPNNANHDGEGYVAFRVKVRDDAPAGRRIDCSASIVFDHNPAIVTSPAWFNWIWDGQSASQDVSTLTWDAVEGGVYGVVIWTGSPDRADADARPVAEFAGLTDHRLPLPADLSSDTTYYWQVTTEADGVTSTSPVWSFELGERLTLALTPGWNLVHLPFAPDDYSSLLLQGHPLFTLEKQVYVRPATLESGRSYWLYQRTTEARGLQVFPAGETRASAASPLAAGWNLTGPASAEATLDDTHAVWRFQGGQWRLVEPDDGQIRLTPGHGYFIYHLNQPEQGRP